ncbi:hypothetical protein O6R08_05105 [Cutibacterium equinum]|uniref:Secreted protein n=1 Tax=Cutibacterium equinum TaxID=3016342 RepID=A0ABY7R2I6_9ACTN|nr:HGxxPAAW family protein [Cutibacterium equinum]WCC80837.1 hypothetical protein O6R08_05105 [Cutibacterium equinum]
MSADRATRQYKHGGTPANWAGSIVALIGFIIAAVGAMAGPSWITCIVGAAVVVLGGVVTLVMRAMAHDHGEAR